MKTFEQIFNEVFEYHKSVVIPDENCCDLETCKKDGTFAMVQDAVKKYTREAIKADRINVAEHLSKQGLNVPRNIANAPEIELS